MFILLLIPLGSCYKHSLNGGDHLVYFFLILLVALPRGVHAVDLDHHRQENSAERTDS